MTIVSSDADFCTRGTMAAVEVRAASMFTCEPGTLQLLAAIDNADGRIPEPSLYVAIEANGEGLGCWLSPGDARAIATTLISLADRLEAGAVSADVQ